MASIVNDSGGYKRILFVAPDGKRKAIRLGKASMKQAEAFKVKAEALIGQTITGALDDEVSRWVAGLDDRMHARLARAGLVKARNRTAASLKVFLDDYFRSLSVKSGTATAYDHTRRYLCDYFGDNCPLRDIEPADADRWRQHLKAAGLSDSTVARRVGVARQMFKRAVRWRLIQENPFADVKAGSQTNKARMFYVTREMAQKVLEACPDAEWRLIFALSRYGGLRCPSEHLALKWVDINWADARIRVPSCKTEHIEGGDCRFIPLFPEVRSYLLEVFEQAPEGSQYVITRYRNRNGNLRTQLTKIIRRAGVKPWPKLFHNLRATRQTELAERYPIHVVCAWLGNSRAVAQEHYLQVTDAHFTQAAQEPADKAAQKAAQYAAELSLPEQQEALGDNPEAQHLPKDTSRYEMLPVAELGAGGFEPPKA